MIKKLICLLVVITLIVMPISGFSEENISKNEKAMAVVTGLGFLDIVSNADDIITRADFVTTSLKLYNIETADEFSEGSDTIYEDVSAEHYRSGDIAKAYNLGIFKAKESDLLRGLAFSIPEC